MFHPLLLQRTRVDVVHRLCEYRQPGGGDPIEGRGYGSQETASSEGITDSGAGQEGIRTDRNTYHHTYKLKKVT